MARTLRALATQPPDGVFTGAMEFKPLPRVSILDQLASMASLVYTSLKST